MNNKKQTTTKIISGLIIFVFVMFIFQLALPTQAASETSMSNYYANPNQDNGKNPYKFKISDVVSAGLLTSVVGCTNVVNKVSTWMVNFVQSPAKKTAMIDAEVKKVRALLESNCASIKSVSEAVGDSYPLIGGLSKSIGTIFSKVKVKVGQNSYSGGELGPGNETYGESKTDEQVCLDIVKAINPEELKLMIKEAEKQNEIQLKEQCFDGIAITLAKNQLTAMTRSMMNWVNSGYGGNPFFVQNMQNFTNNLERNVLETGIDILLAPENQNPYASDFARSTITGRGLGSSSSNFLGNLQSDLGAFITDPKSYYTEEQLSDAERTQMALRRAQEANNAFANDFSTGGWNAWLGLTQRDQNNPLGFTMLASQHLADQMAFETQNIKDELIQNDGFLSQKVCVKWQQYDEDGKPVTKTQTSIGGTPRTIYAFSGSKRENFPDKCADDGWKTITPGSIIKEKTTSYLNSPERQLELAKTINDSLNALFSVLISKLQGGGLSGLSDSVVSTDWTDTMNEFTSPDGNTPYNNNGAYDGFNLTRDLGNTYIHGTFTSRGNWNAKDNCIVGNTTTTCPTDEENFKKLYPDLAPGQYDDENKFTPFPDHANKFYTVKVSGSTKLILEGYNGWAVGDRAFWDGEKWQNWKCGTVVGGKCSNQQNPIKKRGVIQIQEDYIVAAKEILGILPNVMTNLGELDYCIPGPNPNYKTNSSNAQSAFQDWIGSIYVGAIDSTNDRFGVRIDREGDRTYENWKNIYNDNPNVFKSILENSKISGWDGIIKTFSILCNRGESGDECHDSYFYAKNGNMDADYQTKHFQAKIAYRDSTLDYVNNHLFQDFYAVFDKKMNELYFKNITKKYIENEKTSALVENKQYIPMAEAGLDLTKNITFYNDDIIEATNNYNEAIAQAKINIAKLEPIKTEVSGIIKTAQDRRNKRLVDILGISLEQIQDTYATCFAEENIQFYDADTITNMGSVDEKRCSNGIDDDYDGLVDENDPDCNSTIPEIIIEEKWSPFSLNGCIINKKIVVEPFDLSKYPQNQHCLDRSEGECETDPYYVGDGFGYSCKFTGSSGDRPL